MTTQYRFFERPRLWGLISGLPLALAALFILAGFETAHAAPTCTTSGQQVTCTFNFTGAAETWTVPDGVTQATFELYGAQGGNILTFSGFLVDGGGRGGKTTATLTVQPGATYQINVGGQGELRHIGTSGSGAGGFNGGGRGGRIEAATGGGGASDLRTGNFSLAERVLVAGGGGGIGDFCGSAPGGNGGAGGGESGDAGFAGIGGAPGGGPGTQLAGGQGGDPDEPAGFGNGGAGATGYVISYWGGGGGGGGGYYGGGGGNVSDCSGNGGGGGGSGYGPSGVHFENGVRTGDGLVIITYTPDVTAPDTTIDSQPANPSNSDSASFSFSGSDNQTPAGSLTFECSLDAGAFVPCTSPQDYTGLAIGSHTFAVRASDGVGNVDATPASFTWSILPPPPPSNPSFQQIQQVRATLAALLPSGDTSRDARLRRALDKLDLALAATLWQADGNHLTLIGDDVFNRLRDAVKELSKVKQPTPAMREAMTTLATISRTLAQLALDEARAGGGTAKPIAKAQAKLTKGDSEAAKGKLDNAIAYYEDAWEYAQQALGLPVASSLTAEEQTESSTDEVDSDEEDITLLLNNRLFLPLVNR